MADTSLTTRIFQLSRLDLILADQCPWTATSDSSWLQITAGSSGTGSGAVLHTVGINSGALRIGTLNIGGKSFTVTQGGVPSVLRVGMDACGSAADTSWQPLSVLGSLASVADAEVMMPFDGVFTKMLARIHPAPTAGQSVEIVWVLNGVEQATLAATIANPDEQVIVSGGLAFSKGDTMALKTIASSGYFPSLQILLVY